MVSDINVVKSKLVPLRSPPPSTTYFIYPLADFSFKRIFGTESNKELLIAFLNQTLSSDLGVITDVSYLPQEQIGNSRFEKDVIFDIYCTNQSGDHFIIEMQRSKQHFFANRVISYVSRAISNSLRKGDRHYNFPTVYSVNLLDFQPDVRAAPCISERCDLSSVVLASSQYALSPRIVRRLRPRLPLYWLPASMRKTLRVCKF